MKKHLPTLLTALTGAALLGLAGQATARAQDAATDLVSAFTGVKITPATADSPKVKVKGSYSLTNQGAAKAKGFTVGAYLSARPTIFGPDGRVRPDVFPLGVVLGTDASGNPAVSVSLDGGVSKLPLPGTPALKIKPGQGLTLPIPGTALRLGPDFPFNVKIRVDKLPAPLTPALLKGKYLVIVADAENVLKEGNRANNEAALGPLP